jgi:hypothetical protein
LVFLVKNAGWRVRRSVIDVSISHGDDLSTYGGVELAVCGSIVSEGRPLEGADDALDCQSTRT